MSATVKTESSSKCDKRFSFWRVIRRVVFYLILVVALLIFSAEAYVASKSKDRLYDQVEDLPERSAALVLGCSPLLTNGRPNAYFTSRMDAAVEVWEAGKVDFLLLSGDNGEKYYNEPKEMYEALVERGIPSDKLILDYAGFRTLDSVVRAKKVFLQEGFIVISQPFHTKRAVTIARHFDCDAVGYNADAVTGRAGTKTMIRERLARVKLLLDLFVLNKQPKFLGEPVIPLEDDEDQKS